LVVEPAVLRDICLFLRDHPDYQMDYLCFIAGVDYLTHLEVVYHLGSLTKQVGHHRVVLKVRLEREEPRVPTVSDLWPTANWHERECYDLLGVVFEGHPDLRRILLPEVWEGYPLRKDYEYDAHTMVEKILQHAAY